MMGEQDKREADGFTALHGEGEHIVPCVCDFWEHQTRPDLL